MSKHSDNLVSVSVRLPVSLVDKLKAEAETTDRTLADIIRLHIAEERAKPLDKSRRARRKPEIMPELPAGDKAIIAELHRIGASLNQIAVTCDRWPLEVRSKGLGCVNDLTRSMKEIYEAVLCTRNF